MQIHILWKHLIQRHKFTSLLICLAVVLCVYGWNIHQTKAIDQSIFDFSDIHTWKTKDGSFFRIAYRENFETVLTSRDVYREFVFSSRIFNLRTCGIAFFYHDAANHHIVLLSREQNALMYLIKENGKYRKIDSASVKFPEYFVLTVSYKDGRADVRIDNGSVLSASASSGSGFLGLVLNEAQLPRTIFSDVEIHGETIQGRKISRLSTVTLLDRILTNMPSLVFLYGLLVVFVFGMRTAKMQWKDLRLMRFPYLWHICLAFFVFRGFVFSGDILVYSSDNIRDLYPLFLLSKQSFMEILHGRLPILWNSFNELGMPFYSNHWNMIYYPLNWFVFPFSDSCILQIVTLRMLIETIGCGIFSYLFLKEEVGSREWALFGSIVFQFSSFLFLSLSIFSSISLYFSMAFFLFAIWGLGRRKFVQNFVLVSASTIFLLTSANLAMTFYVMLSLIVFCLYRFRWISRENPATAGRDIHAACLGGIIGISISSIRLIPCFWGLRDANRAAIGYFSLHDRFMAVLRMFVPQITGFSYRDMDFFLDHPLRFVFRDMPGGILANNQNTFLVYAGVIPALLILMSFFTKSNHVKLRFWKIYTLIAIFIGLMVQPFWGVIRVLFFPFMHTFYVVMILPVAIAALVAHTAAQWANAEDSAGSHMRSLFVWCQIFINVFLSVVVTYLFPNLTVIFRLVFACGILVISICALSARLRDVLGAFCQRAWPSFVATIGWTAILFLSTATILRPAEHKILITPAFLIPVMISMVIVLSVSRKVRMFWLIWPVIIYTVFAKIIFTVFLNSPASHQTYAVDLVYGWTIFLVISSIGAILFERYKNGNISFAVFFAAIFLITTFDLMAFNLRYDTLVRSSIAQPFSKMHFPYSDFQPGLRQRLDLKNFRVHQQNNVNMHFNTNMIFGVPSYTGSASYLTKRFDRFVHAFGYPSGLTLIHPMDEIEDERFLDLGSVRYAFESLGGQLIERLSALPRLSIFFNYELIADEARMLERLREKNFDPRKAVLIKSGEMLPPRIIGLTMMPVSIIQVTHNEVAGNVRAQAPGVILFNESYHRGWKVFVDGRPAPIYLANFNFMAVAIDVGEHLIEFRFLPFDFYIGLFISLIGIVLFFALIIFGQVFVRKRSRI